MILMSSLLFSSCPLDSEINDQYWLRKCSERQNEHWSTLSDDVSSCRILSNKFKTLLNDRRLIASGMSINDRVISHSFVMIPYLYKLKASIKCLNKQHWCSAPVTNRRFKSLDKYVRLSKYADGAKRSARCMSPGRVSFLRQRGKTRTDIDRRSPSYNVPDAPLISTRSLSARRPITNLLPIWSTHLLILVKSSTTRV